MRRLLLGGILLLSGWGFAFSTSATQSTDCRTRQHVNPLNLTAPITINLPLATTTAEIGTVLYSKESSLAELTGSHYTISQTCLENARQRLAGRISASQRGQDIYSTTIPGIGVRITVIFDKAGAVRREWSLPFNVTLAEFPADDLTSDDIRFRLEIIKTGDVAGGIQSFTLPSLVSLSDGSMVINLAMVVVAPSAHCEIQIPSPQVTLPNIETNDLRSGSSTHWPVSVNLECQNTRKASIRIEGLYAANKPSAFKNIATDNPAEGVGIEMLYNDSTMMPGQPVELTLQQSRFALPLSVRYAKTAEKIIGGNVKAQITIHINYL